MLISLTVGKVDAGVAVLLTEDKRLIEFPSILLPPSITSGSIVDITVARNPSLEAANEQSFASLQSSILHTYGLNSPAAPALRLRNATQTSIVLEWDSLDLATATLRSLSLYRNGAKAGLIPRQTRDGEEVLATKVSGLAVDKEYSFHLVLRTSAGTYHSPKLTVRTQKMTDLTGITVTPGPLPGPLRQSLAGALERVGAKLVEGVRIDTTHFVCTEGRGREWERAVEMNIPVVRPEWVEGCEREGRIVGVRGYYLGADPKQRQVGPSVQQQQQQQQLPPRDSAAARQTTQSQTSTEPENTTQSQSQTSLPHTPVTPFPGAANTTADSAASSTNDLPTEAHAHAHARPGEEESADGDGEPPLPPAKDDPPPPPTITTTAASPSQAATETDEDLPEDEGHVDEEERERVGEGNETGFSEVQL